MTVSMISRQWRGLAKAAHAQAYVEHLRRNTFPQLRKIPGFVDASILRRKVDQGVEFLIVTRWRSMAAIAQFAGRDPEVAVVPENVQAMMVEYDRSVRHYEAVE
jgi:heme-degrading monooxygenase HmoA